MYLHSICETSFSVESLGNICLEGSIGGGGSSQEGNKLNQSLTERSLSFPYSLNCFAFLLLFPSTSFLLLSLFLTFFFHLHVFWGWGKVGWQALFFSSFSLLPALSLPSVFDCDWLLSISSFYFSVLVFIFFISAPNRERDVIITFIERKD